MLQATLALLAEVGFDALSIEAIAARAGVGKTTIYRRYAGKAELVADAIETLRQEIIIPDTGNWWSDIDALIENAAEISLNPLGKQAVAMIISSTLSNQEFAQIYWKKYLQSRRQAFAIVLERAKSRGETSADLEAGLVFDMMSGIMLYSLIFPPETESWQAYVRRALHLFLAAQSAQ